MAAEIAKTAVATITTVATEPNNKNKNNNQHGNANDSDDAYGDGDDDDDDDDDDDGGTVGQCWDVALARIITPASNGGAVAFQQDGVESSCAAMWDAMWDCCSPTRVGHPMLRHQSRSGKSCYLRQNGYESGE